jgi:hypothetical protein
MTDLDLYVLLGPSWRFYVEVILFFGFFIIGYFLGGAMYVIERKGLRPKTKAIEEVCNQLEWLVSRKLVRDNEKTRWEIKLYKWILKQPNAEKFANDYYNTRFRHLVDGHKIIDKEKVVKILGWEIK